jgi:hypothetical protein
MTCYKLTDKDGYTRRGETNETLWGEGVTHTATGTGGLCTNGVIHAYASPELALLMNPIHANIRDPLVWECEGTDLVEDDGTKQGYRTLTTNKRVQVVIPTTEQRITFGILCAKQVCTDEAWIEWANKWLDGSDRTADAADAAAKAANAAVYAGAATCAAACAADAATYTAYTAYTGANTAAKAAKAAYTANAAINIAEIAKQAMEVTR